MQIIIDGKEAVLKQGSSFDFIAENRLFSGSDAYTLSISFPLRDCQQNIDIFGWMHRSELPIDDYVFDCEIRDGAFSRFGTLTIVEISDIDIKGQFLEGRSEQNFSKKFDETYINELDLGHYPSGLPSAISPENAWDPKYTNYEAVALPWVSADSGMPHNFADYDASSKKYTWTQDVNALSWQPYLLHIVRKICDAVGYTYDFSEWENDMMLRTLLICNTLPDAWEVSGYARALPHWTIDEFFEKLELFMRGEFKIDHRACHISFQFTHKMLKETEAVRIERVVDEFSSSVDTEGNRCEYLEAKAFKFADQPLPIWKYWSCDWFFKNLKDSDVKYYESRYDMEQDNKAWMTYNDKDGNHRNPAGSNVGKVLSCFGVYFILRNVSRKEDGKDAFNQPYYTYTRIFQPINEFGPYVPPGADPEDAEELEFVPCCVDFTEEKYGNVIYLSFSSFDESAPQTADPLDSSNIAYMLYRWQGEFQKTGLQNMIEAGETDAPAEYYNVINLGLYNGYHKPGWVCPIVSTYFGGEIIDGAWFGSTLRINEGDDPRWTPYHQIDRTRKVTFKFLADDIPDPRAVFYIKGRRYICEKITATFAEDGMSQLLKGEFWPLLDP